MLLFLSEGHETEQTPSTSTSTKVNERSSAPAAVLAETEVNKAESVELGVEETLYVREGKNLEYHHGTTPPFIISFDDFLYVQFIRCVRDLCIFMSMPNMVQYDTAIRFINASEDLQLDRKDFKHRTTKFEKALTESLHIQKYTEEEIFFVRQYILLNLPLLYAYIELNKLV